MTGNQIDRRKTDRINANLKLEVKVPRVDGSEDVATLETIKTRFDAEGISIPFPQRDVHLLQESAS